MLLDSLKHFSWYNEPLDVRFREEGMLVASKTATDFWQNAVHHFHKDDGHFFYTEKSGNFTLTLQWYSQEPVAFAQCGLMIRGDNLNWAKVGILSPSLQQPQIGSVVTSQGYSDWAVAHLAEYQPKLWYKVKVRNGDCIFYYSLDGESFMQIRQFHLPNYNGSLKVGAYVCSPQLSGFNCILQSIDFD